VVQVVKPTKPEALQKNKNKPKSQFGVILTAQTPLGLKLCWIPSLGL
jgi:hypothetical protein